jgi:hypothetical protein
LALGNLALILLLALALWFILARAGVV